MGIVSCIRKVRWLVLLMANVFFKDGAPVLLNDKVYASVTLKNYRIDSSIWPALSGKKIESLNLSDCTVLSWYGRRGPCVTHLWLENCVGDMSVVCRKNSGRVFSTLILSRCTADMSVKLFPQLGKMHVKTIDLRDVSGIYLTHLFNGNVDDRLKRVRVTNTTSDMRVQYAEQFLRKIAQMKLKEFSWTACGLGDRLLDALDATVALPWCVQQVSLRGNHLTDAVYERLEAFKEGALSVFVLDLLENDFHAGLSTLLQSANDERMEKSESEHEDMDMEPEEVSDAAHDDDQEDDDGTSFSVDDDLRSSGKRKRRRDDEDDRVVINTRGKTLEALCARYFGSSTYKIKAKRI